MFGTLDDLKGKLGLPVTDTSRDDALTLVLEGASAKIEELARFSEAGETGRQDTFTDVQTGTLLTLSKRPINQGQTPVLVEGRWPSTTAGWFTLSADVYSEEDGKVMVLGRDAWWPPLLVLRPPYERWRNLIWPVVRVTYDVKAQGSGSEAPQELQDAALSLASYWYDRDLAGAAESVQMGQLVKELMTAPIPPWVLSRVSKHRKERATWV